MWGLFVGAAAAALAPAGPGALVPLKLAIASADSAGNDVYVAVVVDFGSGSSKSTISACVPVASNAHDADALAAAVGSDDVAYSNSGLVCAIDNYPSNGVQNCGQNVGSGDYDYWSYWHGSTGSWAYANDGPAEQSVVSPSDDVEGWRFQTDEPDDANDPPPGVAPAYAQICNASTEVRRRSPRPDGSTPTTSTTTGPGTSARRPPETERRVGAGHHDQHRSGRTAAACRVDHDHGPAPRARRPPPRATRHRRPRQRNSRIGGQPPLLVASAASHHLQVAGARAPSSRSS